MESRFKRKIDCNKYQSKVATQEPNPYLHYLIDPCFQGVNRLFLLLFWNVRDRTLHTRCYLPKVEITDYNVMIDGKTFLFS